MWPKKKSLQQKTDVVRSALGVLEAMRDSFGKTERNEIKQNAHLECLLHQLFGFLASICFCLFLFISSCFDLFLVSYVEEGPWWPIQSSNKGRKKKAKG